MNYSLAGMQERRAVAERSAFLEKIREATARGRAYRVATNPEAKAEAAYVGGGADPVGSLLQEWIAVGGQGARVSGADAARAFVHDFVERHKIKSAVCWKHPVLDRLGIGEWLGSVQVGVRWWHDLAASGADERWPAAFAADLGVTSVDWAVAETGSLALCALPEQGRVVSLLPPVYLAVVEPSQIVPDLFDLFARLEPLKHALPSNIALVTGPSKTGDIELKLTTGVHGPGSVTLLVVE